jgi:hypothetical protein
VKIERYLGGSGLLESFKIVGVLPHPPVRPQHRGSRISPASEFFLFVGVETAQRRVAARRCAPNRLGCAMPPSSMADRPDGAVAWENIEERATRIELA